MSGPPVTEGEGVGVESPRTPGLPVPPAPRWVWGSTVEVWCAGKGPGAVVTCVEGAPPVLGALGVERSL